MRILVAPVVAAAPVSLALSLFSLSLPLLTPPAAHAQDGVQDGAQDGTQDGEPTDTQKNTGAASNTPTGIAKEPGHLTSVKPKKGYLSSVRIVGARKVEPDAVLLNVQSSVDTVPNQKLMQADVQRMYSMGLFDDVIVALQELDDGSYALEYRLLEKPSIDEILIDGNGEISKDDIREALDLKKFQVLDIPRIRANVEKIKKLYVDKGFYLAEVEFDVRRSIGVSADEETEDSAFDSNVENRTGPSILDENGNLILQTPELLNAISQGENKTGENKTENKTTDKDENRNFVDIVFKVKEKAKVKVEKISFVGNKAISDDAIKAIMRTRENHPLGLVTDWGTYKEEYFSVDLMAIEMLYQDNGYMGIKVGKPHVELSHDKTRISITIPVDEGKQYQLGKFDIEGDLLVEDADLYAELKAKNPDVVYLLKRDVIGQTQSKVGEKFVRSQIAQDLAVVGDRYRDKGYAYVNISPDTYERPATKEGEKDAIDVVLKVKAGPRVTIERIDVVGNSRTQDHVIRRELRVYEGEYYAASQMRLSEQRVNALGFFEKVEITSSQGSTPDRMRLKINVVEKSTGTFQAGAGLSGYEQFLFQGQIAYNNFLGLGQTISGSWQISALRNIIDLHFIDPYFFYIGQDPLTFAFTASNTQSNFIDFIRNSTGGDVTVGYPVGRPFRDVSEKWSENAATWLQPYVPDLENLQLFLTANAQRVEIAEQTFDVRLLGLSANLPRYTTSLRASLIFDQRNNRLFPSQGYFLQAQAEWANPAFGSAFLPGAESALKDGLTSIGLGDSTGFLKRGGRPNDFQRYSLTGRFYYSFDDWFPVKGVVAKVNAEFGLLNTTDRTLIFEQYFLGGFNTVRGYFVRSISPVERVGSLDPTEPLKEFRIGGTKQFYTNMELEFPVIEQAGLRGVIFYDAGNTYGADENFFYLGNGPTDYLSTTLCNGQKCFDPRVNLPLGLYMTAGVGARWFSPLGMLRFECGIPLTPRPVGTVGFPQGDEPARCEFNIGNSF